MILPFKTKQAQENNVVPFTTTCKHSVTDNTGFQNGKVHKIANIGKKLNLEILALSTKFNSDSTLLHAFLSCFVGIYSDSLLVLNV